MGKGEVLAQSDVQQDHSGQGKKHLRGQNGNQNNQSGASNLSPNLSYDNTEGMEEGDNCRVAGDWTRQHVKTVRILGQGRDRRATFHQEGESREGAGRAGRAQ